MEDGDYDIVSGWRKDRKEPFVSRRLPSMLANRLISRTTGVGLHDYGCSLKAYRSEVVKNVHLYGELHRFIPALASHVGVRVTEVPVNDRARKFGKSKYGIGRTFRVILDLIAVLFLLNYFQRPIHIFGSTGLVVTTIGVGISLYLSVYKLITGADIGTRPLLLMGALSIIVGVQMLSIGLVAELQMRTYYEAQGASAYYVRRELTTDETLTPLPVHDRDVEKCLDWYAAGCAIHTMAGDISGAQTVVDNTWANALLRVSVNPADGSPALLVDDVQLWRVDDDIDQTACNR